MKTKEQIEAKLKELNAIETFDYGDMAPLNEYAMQRDLGWRAALKWVLGKDNNGK